MIDKVTAAEILRLYHREAWPVATIASQLGVHRDVVARVLEKKLAPRPRAVRPTMLDPYLEFIDHTLRRWPTIRSSRLFDMCVERGYRGNPDHFRHCIARLRPKKQYEAFMRLRALPGEEGQVDWGHFGHVAVGRARRPLVAFVMVLSWSRMIFLRFFLNARMESFLTGHVEAFDFFDGTPRTLLYDNLKSAVLERRGDAIRFHPTLLELSSHYGFEPRPVAVRRGNEKGRVERAIRFVRDSFFAARNFKDLDDLNAQALAWCRGRAAERGWPQARGRLVREVFLEERPKLQALPPDRFPAEERLEVKIAKTPYACFDGNDYSVPFEHVRSALILRATEQRVRLFDGAKLVAEHERSFDKGACIEDPAHHEALVDEKRRAKKGRATDRLVRAVPSAEALLCELGRRGDNLGSATSQLMRLLETYGPERLERAVLEALAQDSPRPSSVRFCAERERLKEGQKPSVPVALPDDPKVRNLAVRPHDLKGYESLSSRENGSPEGGPQADAEEDTDGKR